MGWRAYRGGIPAEGEAPVLFFFCPRCAEREFRAAGLEPDARRSPL
jgi:hypothetical protein